MKKVLGQIDKFLPRDLNTFDEFRPIDAGAAAGASIRRKTA